MVNKPIQALFIKKGILEIALMSYVFKMDNLAVFFFLKKKPLVALLPEGHGHSRSTLLLFNTNLKDLQI